jgi:NAD(P)-dependent dehydrogenase (short-subunit alcohol dehydrogenase family)
MEGSPTGRLQGRVAMVTGGARGIGFGIAKRLANEGALVVIADINAEGVEAAAAALRKEGKAVQGIAADIGSDLSVAELAAHVEMLHGHCEIVVNNAALIDMTGIEDMSMSHYQKIINVNQHGAIRVCMAFLPLLKKAGKGRRIVNIASIMGMRGSPNSIPYSTAKGAIVNFTRALACDLAPFEITVNAISPGFIDTPSSLLPDGSHEYDSDWFRDVYIKYGRIPLRRYGNPEDIAGPTYFLCCDDSQYVTGQILMVDGGVSSTF